MTILVLSGVLAAGVILGLSIAWFRVQHWKRKAEEAEAETLGFKFLAFMAQRGVEWPHAHPLHHPMSDVNSEVFWASLPTVEGE